MSLHARRREAAAAETHLGRERAIWTAQTQTLRAHVHARRAWWILGGGLAAGWISALLPWRGLAHASRLAGRTLSLALRSPLAALLLASAVKKNDADKPSDAPA